MAIKLKAVVSNQPKTSEVGRLSAQVETTEIELNDARAEVERLERELQAAMLDALEDGEDGRVVKLRRQLAEARTQAEDLANLVKGMQAKLQVARANLEASRAAAAIAKGKAAADEMTQALAEITTAADVIAAAAGRFSRARTRFYVDSPVKPEHVPAVWHHLDGLLQRHIGARSSLFRGAALQVGNIEALARRNEILELHADELLRLFGSSEPPKAA
jgi:hypothetical protein